MLKTLLDELSVEVDTLDLTYGEGYLQHQQLKYEAIGKVFVFKNTIESLIEAEASGFLFHGSTNRLTKVKTNKTHLSKDKVVFAGKLWSALSFIPRWDDSMIGHGTVNGVPYIYSKTKTLKELFDTTGYIHLIPPVGFYSTPSLTGFEFISKEEVDIVYSMKIGDLLTHLTTLGVILTDEYLTT